MNLFSPFPFVRYSLALISGILIYQYLPFYHFSVWLFYSLLFFIHLYLRKKKKHSVFTGLSSLLFLIISGFLLAFINKESNRPDHFSHSINKATYYEVAISSFVEEKAKSYKAVAEVRKLFINHAFIPVSGKVLLYFDHHIPEKPKYGDIILIKGNPVPIEKPKNPEEFDYKEFMSLQQTDFQQYLRPSDFEKTGNVPENLLMNFAIKVNISADSIMKKYIVGKQEYGVANAMILGLRDDLDSELVQAYSVSGAIHILSVSGLHVGVIFIVLELIFGFLVKKGNVGKTLFLFIILFSLWFYAMLTGLSSPVLRSASMFSIITIAKIFSKNQNSYNTVSISAFFLLIWNPYFLFSASFQLSYLAVFGMIYFQPWFSSLMKTGKRATILTRLIDSLWKVTSVALAAQAATFPLTIYYFHQFPNPIYFLLLNPIIIVCSSIALCAGLGFMIIAVPLLKFHATLLVIYAGKVVFWCFKVLNESILFTEKLPESSIRFLHLEFWETGFLFGIIFTLICLWETQKFKYVIASGLMTIILIVYNIRERFYAREQNLFIIHAIPKHSVFSKVEGLKAELIADSGFLEDKNAVRYRLVNFWSSRSILDTQKINLQRFKHIPETAIILWKGKTFFLLNEPLKKKEIQLKSPVIDYLILSGKSVRSFNQIEKIAFRNLVIDCSYSKFYAKGIQLEAAKNGIKCFNLHETGALVLNH